jgi:hypothetical protein
VIVPQTFGVAARFEIIDPNQRHDDESDNWLVQAGASYQLIEQLLEAKLNYVHRAERFGEAQSNDAVMLQFGLLLHPTDRARP